MRNLLIMGAGGFSPLSISSCGGWWELDSGYTLDGNGGLSALTDRSGNGRNLAQSDENKRLVYNATGIGGRPSAQGDGTELWLLANVSGLSGLQGATLLSVCTLPTCRGALFYQNTSNPPLGLVATAYGLHTITVAAGQNYNGVYSPSTSPMIVVSVFDGTLSGNADKMKVWENGVQKTLDFYGTIPSSLEEITTVKMGYGNVGGVGDIYLNGHISAVVFYTRALSDEERTGLQSYYGQKYSVEVS